MPTRYLLVVGTFCLSVLLYIDRACISVAKESIVGELSLSDEQWAWVLAIFTLGYAVFQTPSGLAADRFGPRRLLTGVVVLWSLFTGLTAAVQGVATLLVIRFLFGAGEAGAFPGLARASFSWIPMSERGTVQGINFSGSRLGAALALPGVAWLIDTAGWRNSFWLLMAVGFVFAGFWWVWFRDEPEQKTSIDPAELDYIQRNRQQVLPASDEPPLTAGRLVGSPRVLLLWVQYFASNFTFFFCLAHWFPHLKKTYDLNNVEAGLYASAPLVAGAIGNWFSGVLIDALYRSDRWVLSRRLPAAVGFALATVGVLMSMQQTEVLPAVAWFCLAIFGADMTLAPSWAFCMDIGKRHSGVVSGSMNTAGNLGSFVTALAYFYLKEWSGLESTFFYTAAALNAVAIICWLTLDPRRPLVGENPIGASSNGGDA